jgi:hypothetical protein
MQGVLYPPLEKGWHIEWSLKSDRLMRKISSNSVALVIG